MTDSQIRFDDGAAYEQMMGVWSRLVGEEFVDWLAPAPEMRWLDVGCGNGAFTELLVERCSPAAVLGVDPSDGQLAFARDRHKAGVARFQQGEATALPAADDSFDAAVMALVLFFVPDPAKGLAEMIRVVRPGGTVTAYVWDLLEPDGFPGAPFQDELRARGVPVLMPPSPEVSRMPVLQALWTAAGLIDVATRQITVSRSFDSFHHYWATVEIGLSMTGAIKQLSPEAIAEMKARLRAGLVPDAAGRVAYMSRANAVRGRVPGG